MPSRMPIDVRLADAPVPSISRALVITRVLLPAAGSSPGCAQTPWTAKMETSNAHAFVKRTCRWPRDTKRRYSTAQVHFDRSSCVTQLGQCPGDRMTIFLSVLLAALVLALIPLVPELVRLRIRFLRWIRWTSAADVLDNHFAGWCWFYRVVLGLVAVGSLVAGWAL